MQKLNLKSFLLGSSLLATTSFMTAGLAYAQDAETLPEAASESSEDRRLEKGEVVVTGSRLKKNTFNSISPLQVITTEIAADKGLFNPVEILQTSSTASGQQIDSTFQGFVLDNGPGSETIDLRGLGASRTLVLLNSRRMAPAGVEGAPSQPSINLIPRTLVDRYDLLTDGASSVYGSDAVAGVTNVILKNDFDGLDLDIFADTPEQGAGQDYTIGASYGKTGDRGFFGVGAEYRYQDPWTTADRDFLSGCDTYREITTDGDIRTVAISDAVTANALGLNQPVSECIPSRLTQRFITGEFGSIYYQPGISNTGIPGYSESALFGVPLDGNNDGEVDVSFFNFSPNGQQAETFNIVNEQKQISLMGLGEYTFEGDMNITGYFEGLHVELETASQSGQPQLFPVVPADNQFNPCNFNSGGVDCNAAYNAVLSDPGYQARFAQYYTNPELSGTANCFGLGAANCSPGNFGLFAAPGQLLTAQPVIGVQGDRNRVTTDLAQSRLVAGFRGDLPMINFGDVKDWSFDVSASTSWSEGTSSRSGIRDDRLNLSLGLDPNTGAALAGGPCSNLTAYDPSVSNGCVPVNLFAPSLYTVATGGTFATQAETNYLFDSRDFVTKYSQTIVDMTLQGDVLTLPGGDMSLLLGAQLRKDDIDSQPDDIARDGLFFGFFADGGAQGDRVTKEVYAETFIPLGTGAPLWREFNVELAGRLTDDEFYGTNETYSAKVGYRPVDSLLLKGTIGTSFRAPNLRELFLAGQSGFANRFDPCAVPDDAFNALTGEYNAANDDRSQITLQNCSLAGVDPESFLAGQFDTYSVEQISGGSRELDPETSDSYTIGASFEQPFTDAFDLTLGATYYNIDISNTIVEPGGGFIVNDCYSGEPNLGSAFCSRITRDFTDPDNPGVIDLIDTGFINRNQETAKGLDFNVDLAKRDVAIGTRTFDFSLDATVNHILERKTVDIIAGVVDEEELKGDFGFADWRGTVTGRVDMDRWRLSWTTFFQTAVENDEVLDADDIPLTRFNTNTTCLGADNGDVDCGPVYFADDYFLHSISARYRGDDWGILVGVNNVFDEEPALVDPREVFSVSNVPIGNGYDLNGRQYFVRVTKSFN